MPPTPPPILTPQEVAAALTRLEDRLAVLEAAAGQEAARVENLTKKEHVRADELAKISWAVKHGRKRPW